MESIFETHGDIESSAILNWRLSKFNNSSLNFAQMGEGFFLAAKYAAEETLKDTSDKDYDIVVFPCLFCTIHACELYLKSINMVLESYLKKEKSNPKGKHDIKQIYDTMVANIEKVGEKPLGEAIKQFKVVKQFIDEVYSKTNLMDFPRYPTTDKTKDQHFYVKEKNNVYVNMNSLISLIDECGNIFNRMYWYFAEKYNDENLDYF